MKAFSASILLTLIGFVLGWIVHWLLRRGRWKQTTRRLVETSTDESTKLSQFADGHASELSTLHAAHENELASLRSDHGRTLAMVDDHKRELETHKSEAGRLQGLVGTLRPIERKHAELEKTLVAERADRDRLALEWRTKADTAEAARVKAVADVAAAHTERDRVAADWRLKVESGEKLLTDERKARETALVQLRAEHDKTLGEWRVKHDTVQANHTRVQGLLDTTKTEGDKVAADRDRATAEWRSKYETAEAARAKAVADVTAAHGERDRLVTEWRTKYEAAESARTRLTTDVAAAKGDTDRIAADWRTRAETAEKARLALAADLEKAHKDHEAAAAASRLKVESGEKLLTDERKARETAIVELRAEHDKTLGEWRVKHDTVQANHTRVQGLLDTTKTEGDKVAADRDRATAEWRSKYETAEAARTKLANEASASAAERDKLAAEWRVKLDATEKSLADERADRTAAASHATAAHEASVVQLRTQHDTAVAALRGGFDARARTQLTDREAALRTEFEARAAKERGEHERVLAEARSEHVRSTNTFTAQADELNSRFTALTGQHARLQEAHDDHALRATASETELVGARAQLAEATAGPDDLLVIEGIGPKINTALNAAGIRRFAQVRDASESEMRSALESAGINFAPSITTWSKQAEYLASGDMDGFRSYADYLVAGQDPKLAPLDEGDIEVIPAGSEESGAIRVIASGHDDLVRIEGIGPVIDKALRMAGITTFAELSQSADERLRNALEAAGLRFAPSLATWAEQARLLADGDEAGFAKYTEYLVAGRDPSKANS